MAFSSSSAPAWKGVVVYIALTFAFAWIPTLLLRDVWLMLAHGAAHRLFLVSLLYAVTMGWQPLVSAWIVRRWVDSPGRHAHGLEPARSSFFAVGAFAPLVLAGASLVVSVGAHQLGLSEGWRVLEVSKPIETPPAPSLLAAATLLQAFVCTVLLIWLQALSEEIGWRGYFLVRLMQLLGPWWGLLFHGLVWGLWYAPPLLLVSGQLTGAPPLHAPAFALTCMLLGALLGWLRLASRSIIPTTVANATLTLAAGLPFLLQGTEVGLRGAAYGPPGWFPMVLLLLVLVQGRCRKAVKVPMASTR